MKQMKKKTEQPNNIKRKNIFPLLVSQITMVYSTLLHYIISPKKREKIERKNRKKEHSRSPFFILSQITLYSPFN